MDLSDLANSIERCAFDSLRNCLRPPCADLITKLQEQYYANSSLFLQDSSGILCDLSLVLFPIEDNVPLDILYETLQVQLKDEYSSSNTAFSCPVNGISRATRERMQSLYDVIFPPPSKINQKELSYRIAREKCKAAYGGKRRKIVNQDFSMNRENCHSPNSEKYNQDFLFGSSQRLRRFDVKSRGLHYPIGNLSSLFMWDVISQQESSEQLQHIVFLDASKHEDSVFYFLEFLRHIQELITLCSLQGIPTPPLKLQLWISQNSSQTAGCNTKLDSYWHIFAPVKTPKTIRTRFPSPLSVFPLSSIVRFDSCHFLCEFLAHWVFHSPVVVRFSHDLLRHLGITLQLHGVTSFISLCVSCILTHASVYGVVSGTNDSEAHKKHSKSRKKGSKGKQSPFKNSNVAAAQDKSQTDDGTESLWLYTFHYFRNREVSLQMMGKIILWITAREREISSYLEDKDWDLSMLEQEFLQSFGEQLIENVDFSHLAQYERTSTQPRMPSSNERRQAQDYNENDTYSAEDTLLHDFLAEAATLCSRLCLCCKRTLSENIPQRFTIRCDALRLLCRHSHAAFPFPTGEPEMNTMAGVNAGPSRNPDLVESCHDFHAHGIGSVHSTRGSRSTSHIRDIKQMLWEGNEHYALEALKDSSHKEEEVSWLRYVIIWLIHKSQGWNSAAGQSFSVGSEAKTGVKVTHMPLVELLKAIETDYSSLKQREDKPKVGPKSSVGKVARATRKKSSDLRSETSFSNWLFALTYLSKAMEGLITWSSTDTFVSSETDLESVAVDWSALAFHFS